MMFHSVPVHSLILSSHRFHCLPLCLRPCTVPCRIALASPDDLVTCPHRFSCHFFCGNQEIFIRPEGVLKHSDVASVSSRLPTEPYVSALSNADISLCLKKASPACAPDGMLFTELCSMPNGSPAEPGRTSRKSSALHVMTRTATLLSRVNSKG